MHVSELYLYPIKSARGIALPRAELDERGLRHDRRWMLVNPDGVFISQREAHRMALIDVALLADGLLISAPAMASLRIPLVAEGTTMPARIWRDVVAAVPVDRAADEWFSTFLDRSCRLVFMPPATQRVVDRTYVAEARMVGFADAFPLLIIGQGSLDLLNERLHARGEQPVPMRRFRPNLVIAGTRAHEEDEWLHVRAGAVDVDVVKPCARCVITTVDVETAEAGAEPLRTLSTYRKQGSKVLFGQNAAHRHSGAIAVGDAVTVIRQRTQ